jgi:hypothetical protein
VARRRGVRGAGRGAGAPRERRRTAPRTRGPHRAGGPGAVAVAESRAALATALRVRRHRREVTQVRLAALLGSSQSRVAKMEAADPTVSLELLVRGLVALGATRREVGRIVAEGRRAAAGGGRGGSHDG